ncbi:hypothetical protein L484_024028 [Morus notabilis]|uniref:Uncharacterized protein n=1 Tax=Morus notabilis TaxID=981085 RepID=W9RXR6_9ROSA|nr:hypothetical protein L484_024028 [Morus notabilis]
MGQDQHLVVGGSSGNSDHATVTSATAGDPENQNIPANYGQGVSLEANGTPERR